MATVPERHRATVGELLDLLRGVPADTPVILIAECHGCAEWLNSFAYDTEYNRVELSAGTPRHVHIS